MPAASIRPSFPRAFANREPDMFGRSDTGRGEAITVRSGDVSRTALIARLSDNAPEPLRNAMTALSAGISTFAVEGNRARQDVHPARLPAVLRELATKYVPTVYQGLTKAGVQAKQDAAAAWARSSTPEPSVGTVRQEYRQIWLPLSLAERAARVEHADIDELAAIQEAPGMFRDMTDTPIWGEIERRSAILNTAKKYALNGAFNKQPTVADPLASGPDQAQVEAEAQRLVDTRKERLNNLSLVETTLTSVAIAIAAATELPIEAAYALLMGRE
ncbi:hypothetical protein FJ945_26095 [Mesorhizobium sp. B2-4-9]|uniref:hypothetical protein n=1 Tax=Mesorhizobium sp. B2-4-9 TaxID=2589940 RepID=UPI00112D844C|nr:hypothetical protein [Mesorhizobium sp. B2-4-9]TPL16961.1 hypothetical protein FJ945_26095 [Mesorhizobium sp. B2-4-9]